MRPASRVPRGSWLLLLAGTGALTLAFLVVGLPSPSLFAGLVAGLLLALSPRVTPVVGRRVSHASQAVVGATVGAAATLPALRRLAEGWISITVVTVTTLAISVLAGLALAAVRRDVDRPTGVFALLAGGASGVTAVARDLGTDERVVGVVQYLRVLLVMVTLPWVTAVAFGTASVRNAPDTGADLVRGVVVTVLVCAGGLLVARLLPFSSASLLFPMLLAATLSVGGWFGPLTVSGPLVLVAFAVIGAQVGLGFTRASLRDVARTLPAALLLIVVVVLACGVMAWVLATTTGVDGLTAYLATTPGGLPAVIATASDTGADATYVLAVQLIRLFAVLAALPLLVRLVR